MTYDHFLQREHERHDDAQRFTRCAHCHTRIDTDRDDVVTHPFDSSACYCAECAPGLAQKMRADWLTVENDIEENPEAVVVAAWLSEAGL